MKWLVGAALLGSAAVVQAQAIKPEPPMKHFADDEIAKIEMPDLKFTETPEDVQDYDKYFFFHREGTTFDEAYADIKECDALASGIRFFAGNAQVPYPYAGTMAGAIGGAIGNALADAIFGSAERRRIRRVNLRNCMGFKEYRRYGMERERWQNFNFEEGNGREKEALRDAALLMQARVASGPKPELKVLEP